MDATRRLQALANPKRLAVVRWLKTPADHWRDDPAAPAGPAGVSCTALRRKLRITAASTTRHMQILTAAGFVRARREGKYTFYRLVPGALEGLTADLLKL